MSDLVHKEILEIASELRKFFVYQEDRETEFHVFLCGGAPTSKSSIRELVRERIEAKKSNYTYRVHYPEEKFSEMLFGHKRDSLLDLENFLADSVSSVAILAESPGALVELGAFSNHEKLCKKLIVFLKEEYETHKSFINMGPVRHLRRNPPSRVFYRKLDGAFALEIADRICETTRDIAAVLPMERELTNPISSHRFYLALIYIFDPISLSNVLKISSALATNPMVVENTTTMAVNSLISEGRVMASHRGLTTTGLARDFLMDQNQTKRKVSETSSFLTRMRTMSLNAVLRKKLL